MKTHGGVVLLMCSAILWGGCAVATVQTKSTPAAAQLQAADDKPYVLVVAGPAVPEQARALARNALAKKGFREAAAHEARYRIEITSDTAADGSFRPNEEPLLVRTSHSPYSHANYHRVPHSYHSYGTSGTYGSPARQSTLTQNGRFIPDRYRYAYPDVKTNMGRPAYLHSVTIVVHDLHKPNGTSIWKGSAKFRDANSKQHVHLAALIESAASEVGEPTREPSLIKEWLAAWVAAP